MTREVIKASKGTIGIVMGLRPGAGAGAGAKTEAEAEADITERVIPVVAWRIDGDVAKPVLIDHVQDWETVFIQLPWAGDDAPHPFLDTKRGVIYKNPREVRAAILNNAQDVWDKER